MTGWIFAWGQLPPLLTPCSWDYTSQMTQRWDQVAEIKHLIAKRLKNYCGYFSIKLLVRKEPKFETNFYLFYISILQFYLLIASVKIAKYMYWDQRCCEAAKTFWERGFPPGQLCSVDIHWKELYKFPFVYLTEISLQQWETAILYLKRLATPLNLSEKAVFPLYNRRKSLE